MNDQEFDPDAWMKEQRTQQGPAFDPTFDPDEFLKGLPRLPVAGPGGTPTQKEMDEAFVTTGKSIGQKARQYAPAVGATLFSLAAPEVALPANLARGAGFLPWAARTAASITGAGFGGAAGSGVQQAFDDKQLSAWERLKLAAEEGGSQAAQEALGQGIAAPFEAVGHFLNPKRLYQSALKPSGTLGPKGVSDVLETGLREKIPVSEKGYYEAVARTDALNKQIEEGIKKKSDLLGEVIDPKAHVKQVRGESIPEWKKQVDPGEDVKAIEGVTERYLKEHTEGRPYTALRTDKKGRPIISPEGGVIPIGEIGGSTENYVRNLTAQRAQEIKQGTYKQLRKKYGELGSAEVEAQKGLARAIREDLDKLFPELKKLNKRDSQLIDLEQQLARYVTREGNKQMVGLTQAMIIGGAGSAAAGPPGMTAGFGLGVLKSLIDNPEFKSRLAIALRHAKLPMAAMRQVPRRVIPGAIHLGTSEPQLGSLAAPGVFARGGRMRDPLQRLPDRAATLHALKSAR